MNRKEKFNQAEIAKRALIKAGLIDKVRIGVYLYENAVGKQVEHIKAEYEETFQTFNPADPYIEKTTKKIEEIGRYFSGSIFAEGIIQRKDWLLASKEDRQAYLESNSFAHPAMYKA